jgi:hypothetical protein
LDIGIFETTPAAVIASDISKTETETKTESISCVMDDTTTAAAEKPHTSPEVHTSPVSSDDDFDKITHEEVAEQFALPSVNTKYKMLHL